MPNAINLEFTNDTPKIVLELINENRPPISIEFSMMGPPGADGSMIWGDLTGDIDDQTDLYNRLKKIKALALAGL